ncbi:GGDEF domain-containing protein [Planococcus faecalis]|uniref:GGDEF domain-containing protein n=1 Tax=Planococcus faecalis TaxID=1598147 RepID=UPI00210CB1ED|nr:diguanylate cyclase [Planococcus faecalis]
MWIIFKIYNDTHGHQKGDAVLRSLGQLMKDNTRSKDHVARYGGEEFIFCITNLKTT